MIIYLHGSTDKPPVAEHTVIVAPAGHLPKEFPGEAWWDDTGEKRKPMQYNVVFAYGEAEVPDDLGKYMVATGLAKKSRLVLPNNWSR